MSWAYIDSSVLIATLLEDHPKPQLDKFWGSAEWFISSYLLQAEVFSAVKREKADMQLAALEIKKIGFVRTDSLAEELMEIFKAGYVRGADAFHLATALWIRGKHKDLKFITLDEKQKEIARYLDFIVI